jgi:hypothetical protein
LVKSSSTSFSGFNTLDIERCLDFKFGVPFATTATCFFGFTSIDGVDATAVFPDTIGSDFFKGMIFFSSFTG